MLDKVEVGGGDGMQGDAEVARDAHRFQENFREKHGRAPVQVDTARMHLFHKSAKEAEIEKRSGAQARPVGGGMHVWDVRANGKMNRDGDALFIGGNQNAGGDVLCVEDAAVEELACGFAVADVEASSEFR